MQFPATGEKSRIQKIRKTCLLIDHSRRRKEGHRGRGLEALGWENKGASRHRKDKRNPVRGPSLPDETTPPPPPTLHRDGQLKERMRNSRAPQVDSSGRLGIA